jgi:lipoprotein-anchoring transpeptidase ErfK/SrfK
MLRRTLITGLLALAVTPAAAAAPKTGLFDNLFGGSISSRSLKKITGPLLVSVDITTQQMKVTANGRTIYKFDVSTGRKGYTTPVGEWRPIRMHEMWYSRKYDNSPMPFAIFFYGGYAIHGTGDLDNLGYVASHGCVRLHPENAEKLYQLVSQVGMKNTSIRLYRS